MRFWTGHMRSGAAPALVREGSAWGALLFGPLWLAAHRAWVPAVLALAAVILIPATASPTSAAASIVALAVWLGFFGHDLCRRSMRRRGYTLFEIVTACHQPDALAKLLNRRSDLAGNFLLPG